MPVTRPGRNKIGGLPPSLRKAIASLPPLPSGSPIALLGDSYFNRGNFFTTSGTRTTAENRCNSELMQCHFFDPRFVHRNYWDNTATAANLVPTYAEASATDPLWRGLNQGLSGDTATGIDRRKVQVVSTGAKLCIVDAGTNQGTGDDIATVIAKLAGVVSYLTANGVRVIVGLLRPRRVTLAGIPPDITPAQMQRIITINSMILALAKSWGAVAVWDCWTPNLDPQYGPSDQLFGSPLVDAVISDGVHTTPVGSFRNAQTLLPLLRANIAAGYWFSPDQAVGNLLPVFAGGGGTVGAGFTGNIATGWTIQNAQGAGQPVTGTVAMDNGVIKVTVNSAGGGSANTFNTVRISPAVAPSAGFSATDWMTAIWGLNVTQPGAVLAMAQATLGQTSTISARGHGQTTSAYNTEPTPLQLYAAQGFITTEPLLVESRTSLNSRLDISARADLAGSFSFDVNLAKLQAVPNPQTAFPWVP